jgi:6-pyruvoyltetrahydropterin/6-carboxytetrahydropterin synthase
MKVRLSHQFHFEASHRLSHLGPDNPCYPLHGHSYRVEIVVSGDVDERTGFLIDYADLQRIVLPIIKPLDHTHLNDVPGLTLSTTEHIVHWLWARLKPALPILEEITIRETSATACTYRGE